MSVCVRVCQFVCVCVITLNGDFVQRWGSADAEIYAPTHPPPGGSPGSVFLSLVGIGQDTAGRTSKYLYVVFILPIHSTSSPSPPPDVSDLQQ